MLKSLICKTHGGAFTVEARRGRPPVKCAEDNKCSAALVTKRPSANAVSRENTYSAAEKAASIRRNSAEAAVPKSGARKASVSEQWKAKRESDELLDTVQTSPATRAKRKATSAMQEIFEDEQAAAKLAAADLEKRIATAKAKVKGGAESVLEAQAAKKRLEPLGWLCKGRAWVDNRHTTPGKFAEITATRGEETLFLVWLDGVLTEQTYQVWDMDKPANNGKPDHHLGFDPDEMTDRELVRRLSGMPVVWWNALGMMEEKAIIPEQVQIEHAYNGIGDETPADRIIKFISVGGSYRAFRVGALLKIGK